MNLSAIARYSLTALLVALPSCTSVQVVEKAPRIPVRFATAKAADTFYQALIAKISPGNDQSSVTVGVFMTPPYRHTRVPSDDLQFNNAATLADRDGNGVISLSEAQAYATQVEEGQPSRTE